MTDGIAEFLAARLDDDEQWARKAEASGGANWVAVFRGDEFEVIEGAVSRERIGVLQGKAAVHVVRHDPARVLREVEAGQALLARLAQSGGYEKANPGLRFAVRAAASVYSDHPEYRPEWKP